MLTKYRSVALIPARSGSQRVPHKNIRLLGDHPLLAYSVRAAIESGVFSAVICATDSHEYADIAKYYGAEVPFLRTRKSSGSTSPDIEWVKWTLNALKELGREFDIFSILRPTSPFRLPSTIRRAWSVFIGDVTADSLRAVEKCSQHPAKMWVIRNRRMLPLFPFDIGDCPWHSSQYAALPEIFVQNASLEIAWVRVVFDKNSISGEMVIPFISEGLEGFDINDPEDWSLAVSLIKEKNNILPEIHQPPYSK